MDISGYLGGDGMLFEYLHAPVHPHVMEQVSALQFDTNEELLWIGSETGYLHTLTCPSMERYSSVAAHNSRVQDMVATPAGVLSVSSSMLRLHTVGGLPVLTYQAPGVETAAGADMLSCDVDIRSGQAMVGRKDSALATHDLVTGKFVSKADVAGEAFIVRSLAGRGLVAVGCTHGAVALCDPRANFTAARSVMPHAGGLTAMDMKGDLLATAGLQVRSGQLVMDNLVQVYDMRGPPRAVSHIPFGAGPTMLRFQPMFTSMLTIGSASGFFLTSDVQGSGLTTPHQVNCEGDMMTALAISSSGETTAFGTAGGFVHMWSASDTPRVNHYSRQTDYGSVPTQRVTATEDAGAPVASSRQYHCMDGRPLSDWDPGETMSVGLAPRLVSSSLLKDLKQVDFVGYVSNPKYTRTGKPGESTRLVASLRNRRVQAAGGRSLDRRLGRTSSNRDGTQLPGRYAKMEIRELQSHVRFEEFDFSFYNRTKFAGLENSMANCYCNPLMQVLYSIPAMRAYLLEHMPDQDREFSLTCEAAFLFRMLLSAPRYSAGATCQAANLLRSLRQSREASVLGLLEGHKNEPRNKNNRGDIEVETHKERSLSRRVQSLSRFVLEHLHREVLTAGATTSPISDIFGIDYRQRMQCLGGSKAEQMKEARSFQVELQYPPASQRPALEAASTSKTRPSFASLLAASMRTQSDLKAWFDEKHGYQMVRQTRVPTCLPKIIVVSCGMQDRKDLAWWMPVKEAGGEEKPWLPWAVEVETQPQDWEVVAREVPLEELAGRAEAGEGQANQQAGKDGGSVKALYVLTATIVHVQDSDDMGSSGRTGGEGHVVAHVKALPRDYHPVLGLLSPFLAPSPAPETPSSTAAAPVVPPPLAAAGPNEGATKSQQASSAEGGEVAEGLPVVDTLVTILLDEGAGSGEGGGAALAGTGKGGEGSRPALTPIKMPQRALSKQLSVNLSPMPNLPVKTGSLLAHGWPGYGAWDQGWLIHNDFCIVPCDGPEVLRLYGEQKVPCLLYYTQVSHIQQAGTVPQEEQMPLIMNPADFAHLCNSPPLQEKHMVLKTPTFRPLDITKECPRPGMLLAIDAEFVMFSPEEKVIESGVETVTRPARLGLARISVLRGDAGPLAGECCIDDYVRTVEPVYDYLTRYSGLTHGDLDPVTSKHYLTTLKRAYMKLRYLVDVGCKFIGHGLKKDFRMINIAVPPEQVIDTVELFYLKRHRKLSLRFLAAYLLRIDIQQETHDSIEDARTALRLYEVYQHLVATKQVDIALQEIYDWGQQFGWEPSTALQHRR